MASEQNGSDARVRRDDELNDDVTRVRERVTKLEDQLGLDGIYRAKARAWLGALFPDQEVMYAIYEETLEIALDPQAQGEIVMDSRGGELSDARSATEPGHFRQLPSITRFDG